MTMLGQSLVFYFKYGRQLDQLDNIDHEEWGNVIRAGLPSLTEDQIKRKIEMIDAVFDKANVQAKAMFNELAKESGIILSKFCKTELELIQRLGSTWQSSVYISPKTGKKGKRKIKITFLAEDEGPEVQNTGYFHLEMIIKTMDSVDDDKVLYDVIKKIYKNKFTVNNWQDWDKNYDYCCSIVRVPVYRSGVKNYQVEKEPIYEAILKSLQMLTEKDLEKILKVMFV